MKLELFDSLKFNVTVSNICKTLSNIKRLIEKIKLQKKLYN